MGFEKININNNDKKTKIFELQAEIEDLLMRRDTLEAQCGQLICEEYFDCKNCKANIDLSYFEDMTLHLGEELEKVKEDIDTWEYTIMGNKKAYKLWGECFELSYKHLTREEDLSGDPPELRELIERCYKKLIEYVQEQKSRLAFQVLGVFLMESGAKMTEDVRELILRYSEWKDEKDQLENKQDRRERKKYLLDFREKIKNYKNGIKTIVLWDINFKKQEKKPIDYRNQ